MTIEEYKIQYALGLISLADKVDLASSPTTPIEILEMLSEDENSFVRHNVAKNPNTPKEVLEKLSKDKNYWVRNNVARNPSTPIEILERLSKDENHWVRSSAQRSLGIIRTHNNKNE